MKHKPVMVDEVLSNLEKYTNAHLKINQEKKSIIDATLGFGGHTIELLKNGYRVLGIEVDSETLEVAAKKVSLACPDMYKSVHVSPDKIVGNNFTFLHANFTNLSTVAQKNGFGHVDAILFDLGVNSYQLTSETRGFSFREKSAELDMRMDRLGQKIAASDLLNSLREDQLIYMFEKVLDRSEARYLSKRIVRVRKEKNFETVGDLLDIMPRFSKKGKINPATKAFLALRMAVNSELENIETALPQALNLLVTGGILLVITFHSGEDKFVKNYFQSVEANNEGKMIKKPILPSNAETERNNRARSAKLRILIKND